MWFSYPDCVVLSLLPPLPSNSNLWNTPYMQNSVFNNLSNLSNLRCLLFIYLYFFCFFFLCISKFSSFKYNLLFFFVTSSVTFSYFFNISHFVWKFLWQRQISLITFDLFCVQKHAILMCDLLVFTICQKVENVIGWLQDPHGPSACSYSNPI